MRVDILLILAGFSAAAAPTKYRPILHFSSTVHIEDKVKYARHLGCMPSFGFAHLIVIDSSCGRQQGKCHRYCEDRAFTDLYCDFRCHSMAPQQAVFFCNFDYYLYRYNGSESKTSKLLGDWEWQSPGMRRMYGQRWSERIRIASFPVFHNEITRIRMVSASSFDKRVLGYSDGIMGLAPGADNPFLQMTRARNLPPLISMAHTFWAYKNIRMLKSQRPITVGSLDKSRCIDWKFIKSISKDRWVFEIDQVDFMGVRTGKSTGTFSYDLTSFATIGSPTADQLVSAGVATRIGRNINEHDYFAAQVPCDYERAQLPPTFIKIGKIRLTFNESATFGGLMYKNSERIGCLLNVNVDYKSPHQNANVWVFGRSLLREYCLAFDYEKLLIGFGRMRKSPFPYTLPQNAIF